MGQRTEVNKKIAEIQAIIAAKKGDLKWEDEKRFFDELWEGPGGDFSKTDLPASN